MSEMKDFITHSDGRSQFQNMCWYLKSHSPQGDVQRVRCDTDMLVMLPVKNSKLSILGLL
jgi:hypothetical protein